MRLSEQLEHHLLLSALRGASAARVSAAALPATSCYLPPATSALLPPRPRERRVPPGRQARFSSSDHFKAVCLSKGLSSQARHLRQSPKDRESSCVQANQDMPAHPLLMDDETEVPADGDFECLSRRFR